MFIKLTLNNNDNEPIYVNIDTVVTVSKDSDNNTLITFNSDNLLYVKESPDEIVKLISIGTQLSNIKGGK